MAIDLGGPLVKAFAAIGWFWGWTMVQYARLPALLADWAGSVPDRSSYDDRHGPQTLRRIGAMKLSASQGPSSGPSSGARTDGPDLPER